MQTNILRATALAGALYAAAALPAGAATYPFQDPNLPPQQRIANILSLMTPEEKIAALSPDSGVARLGIPSFGATEGIHGLVQRGESKRQREPIKIHLSTSRAGQTKFGGLNDKFQATGTAPRRPRPRKAERNLAKLQFVVCLIILAIIMFMVLRAIPPT